MRRALILVLLIFVLFARGSCLKPATEPEGNIDYAEGLPDASHAGSFGDKYDICYAYTYYTLEDTIREANNIVVAQFDSVENYGEYRVCKFLVEEQLKGVVEESFIYVQYYNDNFIHIAQKDVDERYEYSLNKLRYENGRRYVLVLQYTSNKSAYRPYDKYIVQAGLYLPAFDMDALRIYVHENLRDHAAMRRRDTKDLRAFLAYIRKIAEQENLSGSSLLYEIPYIASDNLTDILAGSEYVVRLIPRELAMTHDAFYGTVERYECDIVRQYKGSVVYLDPEDTVDKMQTERIDVEFVPGTVSIGKEYIVAVDRFTRLRYLLTADAALMDVSMEDTVLKILGLA